MFKGNDKISSASARRELSYKFGSIIIFSSGRAKFELGSGSEQMLDSYAASLALRLVCRGSLTPETRTEALTRALEKLGLPADTCAVRDYAMSFLRLACDFGRAGKTMKYVEEFLEASYAMLSKLEAELAAMYPHCGFGNLALELMNSVCEKLSIEPLCCDGSKRKRSFKKSAAEWIAAIAAAAMLPMLL